MKFLLDTCAAIDGVSNASPGHVLNAMRIAAETGEFVVDMLQVLNASGKALPSFVGVLSAVCLAGCATGVPRPSSDVAIGSAVVLLSSEEDEIVWEADIDDTRAVLFFALPGADSDILLALSCPFKQGAELQLTIPHPPAATSVPVVVSAGRSSVSSRAHFEADNATDWFYAQTPVSLASRPMQAFRRTGRLSTRGEKLNFDIVVPANRLGEVERLFTACLS